MNYLIFDVIIALILLFALWRGYSRGFILTLCGFLAIFVAFIGATVISDNLARPVADAIRPAIERQIQGTLEQSLQVEDSLASTGGEAPALEELPISEVLEALQESALYRGLAQAFQEAVDNGVAQVTTSAARALAEYAAVQLARMVLFLLAFVAVLIAWFLLSHALDLAFRLPVLSALNHWSGAALGLLKGGALIFIACWLLQNSLIPPEAIQNTYLLNFFCTFDPLSLLA